MFGIASFKETDDWVRGRFGRVAATIVAVLALLSMISAFVALIALGVKAVTPLATALWSLAPGAPSISINWQQVLPSSIAVIVVGLVSLWTYRRLRDLSQTVDLIRDWLAEPLEERLKLLELNTTSTIDSTNEIHKTVAEQIADLRTRVIALERHTDISGLLQLLTERRMRGMGADGRLLSARYNAASEETARGTLGDLGKLNPHDYRSIK